MAVQQHFLFHQDAVMETLAKINSSGVLISADLIDGLPTLQKGQRSAV